MAVGAGTVSLVGAGPGDPELLTVKAYRLLADADVVCYDALTGEGILELAEGAETIDVGKRPKPDGERTTQEEINRLMVRRAHQGQQVVRLKGGDPCVFGRGGEEAEHLAAAGVAFEIVPGITSAIAAPEAAGIPVTHRDHASAMTVVTGHEDPSKAKSALDWEALARTVAAGGTLVVLMGVRRLPEYCTALGENGVDPDTPVAVIERATLPEEFTVTGTLATIAAESRAVGIESPAATVIGDVVGVRERVAPYLDASVLASTSMPNEGREIGGVRPDGGNDDE